MHFMGMSRVVFTLLGFGVWAGCPCLAQSHSATVEAGADPNLIPSYTGTSTPSGPFQINFTPGTPGYLNGISGGQDGGSEGMVLMSATGPGSVYSVGLAMDVSDTAGPSHSLSSQRDPALGDIVNDLRGQDLFGNPLYAYAYNNAPSQYAAAESVLSAGESANGGKPFDILLVGTDTTGMINHSFWSFGFSNEIGHLDGITSLGVTDIGALSTAVPEPSSTAVLMLALPLLIWRRRQPTAPEPSRRQHSFQAQGPAT